jgi:chromosome partitioning protein
MPAIVITVAQQKGGAGKTTLAAHLAAFWAAERRVSLLDIDPQASLARWHGLRGGRAPALGLAAISGWRLAAELDRAVAEAEIVMIDTPPQIDSDSRRAIRAADLVLLPVQPSPPDLWAAEGTLALAAAERRRAALVLNRASAASRLQREVEAAIGRAGHRLLAAPLGDRRAYAQAFAQGMGVTEMQPRSPAAAELRQLAGLVLESAR